MEKPILKRIINPNTGVSFFLVNEKDSPVSKVLTSDAINAASVKKEGKTAPSNPKVIKKINALEQRAQRSDHHGRYLHKTMRFVLRRQRQYQRFVAISLVLQACTVAALLYLL